MGGTRIEQGLGESALFEDQGCTGTEGNKGRRSTAMVDAPADLMAGQPHANPRHASCFASEAQRVTAIAEFRLVTADLPRLSEFYQDILGFISDGPEHPIDCDEMRLLGLTGSGRRGSLRFGQQRLSIDQFDHSGQPYPTGTNAASLSFQDLALLVNDMAEAYQHVRTATAISVGGPQRLPASAGGVFAFKFRDPDGHSLKLLQLRAGAWQMAPGIDHSAISVADTKASRLFYEGLGLKLGHHTINHGPDQARLDDLEGVVVAMVPMLPQIAAPHLKLLGYHVTQVEAPCHDCGAGRPHQQHART